MVRRTAKEYPKVDTRIYEIGKDMDYISKYGAFSNSVLIINETEQITNISKSTIRKAFEKAMDEALE